MKNISLVINLLLVVAVGYLYYHNFSGKKTPASRQDSSSNIKDSSTGHRSTMAYFNIDSVENSFEFYKEQKANYDKFKAGEESALKNLQEKFQSRLMQLQQMNMTPADQEKARAELEGMQKEFQDKKNVSDNNVYKKGVEMTDDIYKKINDYLKIYNTPQRYDFIIEYNPQMVFYKDSTLDITGDLVKGLNENYNTLIKKKDK